MFAKDRTNEIASLRFIKEKLTAGEVIVWADQPNPEGFSKNQIGIAIFGIFWTAFSLFWMFAANGFNVPFTNGNGIEWFALFGLPFLLIGIGLITSPIYMPIVATRTYYFVTQKRACIYQDLSFYIHFKDLGPHEFNHLGVKNLSGEFGTVDINKKVSTDSKGKTSVHITAFKAIREAETVHAMLVKLRDAAGGNAQPNAD